jgi:hypothetical protein
MNPSETMGFDAKHELGLGLFLLPYHRGERFRSKEVDSKTKVGKVGKCMGCRTALIPIAVLGNTQAHVVKVLVKAQYCSLGMMLYCCWLLV